ncbi:efflux RND transporter periplasmic adaptor subunit [bacterium]|nr:efflux RND transporter periplasmic adaptor subunit [bacterium]
MAENKLKNLRKTMQALKSAAVFRVLQESAERLGLRRIRRPVLWGSAAFLVLLLLLTCPRPRAAEPGREEWAVVEQKDFSVEIVESGDLEAVSQRLISAPQVQSDQMQVIELVPEGSIVKQGDFLIQFDVSQLETNLALAEQDLAASLADLDRIKAQQSLTYSNLENTLKLTAYSHEQSKLQLEAQQYESETKKEQARLALKQAEMDLKRVRDQIAYQEIMHASQMTLLETAIRKQRNELKSLREQIIKQKILAPIGGMVVYQEVGSWQNRERLRIGYKARPGEPLISIPDLSRMQVKLYLNEIDRSEIEPGLKARVILDAYPDTVFNGRVRELANLAQNVDEESELKGFVVYVDLDGSDIRLKPGLSARVRIELTRVPNACVVPVGTLYEIHGKPVVFQHRKARSIPIVLGPRNDASAVVQGAVKPGMKLSWEPNNPDARPLGYADEKKRTDDANRLLIESIARFEKRGILYDYSRSQTGEAEKEGASEEVQQLRIRTYGSSGRQGGWARTGSRDSGNIRQGRRRAETGNAQAMPADTFRILKKMEAPDSGLAKPESSEQRQPGFTGKRRFHEDSTGKSTPGGGFERRNPMIQDSLPGGFPPVFPGFRLETVPDSVRRRFRRDGFGPGRGRPPDSVLERMRESRMRDPGQRRERTERFRQWRPPSESGGDSSSTGQ